MKVNSKGGGINMNKKLKWKYDKRFMQYYSIETEPYANDGFVIEKKSGFYYLDHGSKFIYGFNKLTSAKKVADLIRFG